MIANALPPGIFAGDDVADKDSAGGDKIGVFLALRFLFLWNSTACA